VLDSVPDDHRFASHDQLEHLASRNPVRFSERFDVGTKVEVGGRTALISGIEVNIASGHSLRVAVSLRYLDEAN
jgi:hypothetical protein